MGQGVSCDFVPLRPKYFPQHPVLKHLQATIIPLCARPCFTPILITGNCNVPIHHDRRCLELTHTIAGKCNYSRKNTQFYNETCKCSDINRKPVTGEHFFFFLLAKNTVAYIVTYMIYTVHIYATFIVIMTRV